MITSKKTKRAGNGRDNHPEPQLYRNHNLLIFLILTAIALAFIIISPVKAGEQYMAGSPDLSAAIDGTNELLPGSEEQLAVLIQNTGVNQFKFVKTGIVDRDDLPYRESR